MFRLNVGDKCKKIQIRYQQLSGTELEYELNTYIMVIINDNFLDYNNIYKMLK